MKSKGFSIVARNYRCKLGELDIVARDAQGLIVVEVKTVSSLDHADAGDRATREKWRRVFRATQHFLQKHNLVHASVRFDLITVVLAKGEKPVIEHHEGAWEA